jgi:hormone-sensitive lipase
VDCHLISPIKTPDEILAKFPKTKIMIASNDPIRDESYRLTLKLLRQKVDVELKEFKLMPHGFLSYNFPMFGMREEAQEAIRIGAEWLKELSETEPS